MTVIVNEQDIEFCVDAIKLIKDNNATYIKKDTSNINDKCIDIYKNMDDEVVIKIKEIVPIKAESPQRNYEEQPYEGSPLEKKRQLEQATALLKTWIEPRCNYEECLHLTEEFLNSKEEK